MDCLFRKFVLLQNESDWDKYLAQMISRCSILNLRVEPVIYPCLVTMIEFKDIAEFCFVYPQDAQLLLEETATRSAKTPEAISTFMLAMFLELQEIGAIKQERFEEALKFLNANEKLLNRLARKESLPGLLVKIREAYRKNT